MNNRDHLPPESPPNNIFEQGQRVNLIIKVFDNEILGNLINRVAWVVLDLSTATTTLQSPSMMVVRSRLSRATSDHRRGRPAQLPLMNQTQSG